MKSWYIISAGVEHKCEFVSVNILKLHIWLKLNEVSFKTTFHNKRDYDYAKRGEPIHAIAKRKGTLKSIKIVFK